MRESVEADWEKSYGPQPTKSYELQNWGRLSSFGQEYGPAQWVGSGDHKTLADAVAEMERKFHHFGGQWRVVEMTITVAVVDSAGDADHVAWVGNWYE